MGYGPLNGPSSPLVKMVSTTTGWALGGLQTTDGGAHWRDTSPSALRDDAPTNLATTLYPPGYADFYLDAAHAWEVRSYASSTSCVDHISVFVTADGGRSWQQSEPIGDGAKLRAEARDKSFKPISNARVEAHISGPEGTADTVELTPVPLEEGVYSAEWAAEKCTSAGAWVSRM